MSKYIIEVKPEYEDKFKGVMILGAENSNLYVDTLAVESLEQYTPVDVEKIYDKACRDGYNKGFEDGKNSIDKGCEGCKYKLRFANDDPCKNCSNCYTSKYTPMPKQDDSIKVGDEVTAPCGKAIVTAVKDDLVHYFYSDGDFGCIEPNKVTKTGKHYDIASMLEEMKK